MGQQSIAINNAQNQEFKINHNDNAGAISIDSDKIMTKVSSTDNAIVRFDGTTGNVQNSSVIIDDSGNIGSGTQSFNGFGGSGFKNYLYNPKFDVVQRGTVFQNNGTTGKVFTVDRWSTYFYDTNNTRFVNTTTGEISNNAIKFGRFDNKSDTYPSWIAQELEIKDSIPLKGKTVTVSFWAKKGSGLTSPINVNIRTGTAGDESWTTNWVGNVDNHFYPNLTTTLTKYSYTVTLNSNIKQIGVLFCLPGFPATVAVNDWVWIEQVQLEEGSVATPFENRPYGLELSLCQRYYQRGFQQRGVASSYSIGYVSLRIPLHTSMRVIPTISQVQGATLDLAIEVIGFGSATPTSMLFGGARHNALQVDFGYTSFNNQINPVALDKDIIQCSAEL